MDDMIYLLKTEHTQRHYAIPKSELTPSQLASLMSDPNGEGWELCEGDHYEVDKNSAMYSYHDIDMVDAEGEIIEPVTGEA